MKRILEKKFRKIITLEDEMLQTLDDIIENFDYVINPNCNKDDILAKYPLLGAINNEVNNYDDIVYHLFLHN